MNCDEISLLLNKGETDRIEWTTSPREDKLGPAVCALANDFSRSNEPGYILFGVGDDGKPVGLKIGDEILLKIADVRSNGNLQPLPVIHISEVCHYEQGDVVAIEVACCNYPPMRFRGRVYIRVGPRNQLASEQEERILMERRAAPTFDLMPCVHATLDDLALNEFYAYLRNVIPEDSLKVDSRSAQEQMAALRLWDIRHDCPTHAAILLFGIDPLGFIPGAFIQYVKVEGTELGKSDISMQKTFTGSLMTQLFNVDNFVNAQVVKSRLRKVAGTFQETVVYNYHPWALRELLMNALMHRDYQSNAPVYVYEFTDRIELKNPGGLFGIVNRSNFPQVSDYRNPELAIAMKNLGYVNRFNIGVRTAQNELKKNGNPPAEFYLDEPAQFMVSIKIHPSWITE
ncbi:MAG: hypothetical protein KatS3mg030_728 [Saprospiraceae bacterium]|nr:MAG: hypothetical protein KatS3mg030_728 [Saprospiraceae bacterium]